jgi:hypothetical protein
VGKVTSKKKIQDISPMRIIKRAMSINGRLWFLADLFLVNEYSPD